MRKMIFWGWWLLFFASPVYAQEKVEAPIWNVGDKWDFGRDGFLEVVGVDKNGYVAKFLAGIFFKSAQGTVLFDKSTFSVLYVLEGDKRKKYEGAHRMVLNFPLVIGKKWKDEVRILSPDGFHSRDGVENYKVQGWEEVMVPAGKFKAMKLEYTFNYGPPAVGYIYESKAWYWYSPELKYMVKGQYGKGYEETSKPMDPSYKGGREDWKLIFFKLKK